MELLRTFASESSIHGLAHLVPRSGQRDSQMTVHWLEKVFWLVVLLFSVVCSVSLCNSHWQRFRDNATVLNVETDYLSWVFRPPAATVCSGHVTEAKLNDLLAR
ncbi:pickpocket [Anopheles darlingi]|uniref:Pickpocket n=1 Tax=Anopheles darlingi TaxID=43151 RepID=W5JQ91_ANODA|nr:pickpocket [Anopheles darlingi]